MLAARGRRDLDAGEEPEPDGALAAALRGVGRRISLAALLVTALVALVLFAPRVFGS